MNTSPGGIPIVTRQVALQRSIRFDCGTLSVLAFTVAEYNMTPHQHYSAVVPTRATEKIMRFSGSFLRAGELRELTLQHQLHRDEIARSLARINLLNQFFSDVGRRFETGVETLIPLFDGLQAGFRKIDFRTTGTVLIFEQDGARGEFVSETVVEMTDLRDALGTVLNL